MNPQDSLVELSRAIIICNSYQSELKRTSEYQEREDAAMLETIKSFGFTIKHKSSKEIIID
jgi:hypothetical protein